MDYRSLLHVALEDLYAAIQELLEQTTPRTPLPRARQFSFLPGLVWPSPRGDVIYVDPANRWYHVVRTHPSQGSFWLDSRTDRHHLANMILDLTGEQPRRILRAYNAIRAATAWCRARAEGRRRHAEEILRQQAKAVCTLEAEMTLLTLGGDRQ